MKTNDFNYILPEELIAQEPTPERTDSRLLVLNRRDKTISHRIFKDIVEYLNPCDLLVFNDTRVIPARLYGEKEGSGGRVEVLLVNEVSKNKWEAMVKPGRRVKPGHTLIFGSGALIGKVIDWTDKGTRIIEFFDDEFFKKIEIVGKIPLPPYIKKPIEDKERYQTVFAKNPGSSAAPTAALHFNEDLLGQLKRKGIRMVYLTLHVGPGTFLPVKTENITDHRMHSEYYKVPSAVASAVNETKKNGGRIIPVGTTSVRSLESAFDENRNLTRPEGWTDIFIYPGYKFKMADALITNFHLPRSTLLMLVSAFAGRKLILAAYEEAVKERYRFFSFGDCMMII